MNMKKVDSESLKTFRDKILGPSFETNCVHPSHGRKSRISHLFVDFRNRGSTWRSPVSSRIWPQSRRCRLLFSMRARLRHPRKVLKLRNTNGLPNRRNMDRKGKIGKEKGVIGLALDHSWKTWLRNVELQAWTIFNRPEVIGITIKGLIGIKVSITKIS